MSSIAFRRWVQAGVAAVFLYFIPQFSVDRVQSTKVNYSDEAFWIQKRVLKWGGYPKLTTLDDYFDLICAYLKANPETDGEKNIGFEILCDDWRYFCLENPPMFLAGYPNEGCAIVDSNTKKAHNYDMIPEAKQYFHKLSELYNNNIIDHETFTLTYQQYIGRLSSGNVLGMVDQYWQFMAAQNSLYAAGGIGISVNCKDVKGALQFINDLLDGDIMVLRNWGECGVEYEKNKRGVFYRTQEQREKIHNDTYRKCNLCSYGYFPGYGGYLPDGINTSLPEEQPEEYYTTLSNYDKEVLDAYGHKTWAQFMGDQEEGEPWFPLYFYKDNWSKDTPYGKAAVDMKEMKMEWLPKIIVSPLTQFEQNWTSYQYHYEKEINVKSYEEQLDKEIKKKLS